MKKTTRSFFIYLILLIGFAQGVHAQNDQPRYKDVVTENPNAEADIKVVSDYVHALVDAKIEDAKAAMAVNYKGLGPAGTDSATAEETITNWQENYKTQSNRKADFVTESFKVLMGDLQGSYVSMWGTYSFTQNGKDVSFPYQFTARVTDGKIDRSNIYYDKLSIFQALGYKLTPPDGMK